MRLRGCWDEIVGLLVDGAQHTPGDAVELGATLVEKSTYTLDGWALAEDALRQAEQLAEDDRQLVGAVHSERALLYWAMTRHRVEDRGADARTALAMAEEYLPLHSPRRRTLTFRRGLVVEYLDADPAGAVPHYEAARQAARDGRDELLASLSWRQLGSCAQAVDDVATAAEAYREALRAATSAGYLVGLAPALAALAEVAAPEEADRLRSEAGRLVSAFDGLPVWLAHLT
ncbi:hypothetical protein GCM10023223_17270 [Stackebrandtia albiflava]